MCHFGHETLINSLRRYRDALACLEIKQMLAFHFKSLVSVTPKSLVFITIIALGIGVTNDGFDLRKLNVII